MLTTPRRFTGMFSALLACAMLASCGGGDGSSSRFPPPTPPPPQAQPPAPPPPPPPPRIQPQYDGKTETITVAPENASVMTLGALRAGAVYRVFTQNYGTTRRWAPQQLNAVENGAAGGTATVVDGNPPTWRKIRFDDYRRWDGGMVINGMLIEEPKGGDALLMSFDGLVMADAYGTWSVTGHLDFAGDTTRAATLCVTLTDGALGRVWYTCGAQFASTNTGTDVTVSATVHEASLGKVTFAAAPILAYDNFPVEQLQMGAATLTGGTTMRVDVLNEFYLSYAFPDDKTLRHSHRTLAGDAHVPGWVEADSGPGYDQPVRPIDTILFDGRLSSAGNAPISYEWTILQAPPGDHGHVWPVRTPTVLIESPVAGSYLLRLRVTDGVDESFDETLIEVSPSGSEPVFYRHHSGPSRVVAVGERVVLDIHRSLPIRFSPSSGVFVTPPYGFNLATLDTTIPEHPVLTPDAQGLWRAIGVSGQRRPAYIAAGVPLPPTLRVGLIRRFASSPKRFLAEDLSGSGYIDVVVAEYHDTDTAGRRITLVSALGDGRISSPTTISEGGAEALGALDFTSDGRTDLVALRNNTLVAYAQLADGAFEEAATISLAAEGGENLSDIAVGDYFGTGLGSIAVIHRRSTEAVTFFDVEPGGGFGASREVPIDCRPSSLRTVRATAGAPLLYVQCDDGTDHIVHLYEGQGDGSLVRRDGFTLPITESTGGLVHQSALHVVVADVMREGRDSLVATSNHGVRLYRFDEHGALLDPEWAYNPHRGPAPVVGDFIGEGRAQILLGEGDARALVRVTATGELEDAVHWSFGALVFPQGGRRSLGVDFDGDGIDDILTLISNTNYMLGVEYGRPERP